MIFVFLKEGVLPYTTTFLILKQVKKKLILWDEGWLQSDEFLINHVFGAE